MINEITIDALDGGSFQAYVARPYLRPAPALVLIQYICGVNQVMRRIADHYASLGYLVVVPDVFWRQEPGVQLNPDPARPTKEGIARALELEKAVVDELAVSDLAATAEAIKQHPDCNGVVGALGYCLGGRLVVPMAAKTDLACAISYYGVRLGSYMPAALAASCPMLLHLGGSDALVPPEEREIILRSMALRPNSEVIVHDSVNHAFALPSGPNYNPDAAIRANWLSLRFLSRHMPVPTPEEASK